MLILIKPFDQLYPKHASKMDMITAIEKHAEVRYWHKDGRLTDILSQLAFTPDFIFHYDTGHKAKPFAPDIKGLAQTKIAKGCFVIDAHTNEALRAAYFKDNRIDLIFSVGKHAFLTAFPRFKKKFRWLPWAINPKVFYDRKQKKEMMLLLMGLVHTPTAANKGYKTPAKGKYAFRDHVLSVFRDHPDFFYIPHPGHLTDKEKGMMNENYAKAINRAHIFFTCGARIPRVGSYPVQKFFEVPASKTLLLAESNRDIEELGFVNGVNYVACTTDNVYKKARYYMKNPAERIKITEAGYKFIHKKHTNDVRAKQFVEMVKDFLLRKKN
ncbi:Glycosyl transferases group 1 [Shouchella lonarensis]|uniref:Glycosyl transferases group 1 n=1 Tax=Shouchella lonarensis TaxID=1464122 RepID=A0A1G6L7B1_9BACI|nr:Glycosyl transferases group 1 [Shouchella lonarensis]